MFYSKYSFCISSEMMRSLFVASGISV